MHDQGRNVPGSFDVMGWKDGQPDVFTQFFVQYYPEFYSFALSLLENSQSAKNVSVEAMFLLWKKRGELETLVNCKTFLYNTVRHQSLMFLKFLQQDPGAGVYTADKRSWPILPAAVLVEILAFAEGASGEEP